jgi:hypothetical protein
MFLEASPLRPHCVAQERIHVWCPVTSRAVLVSEGGVTTLNWDDLERIKEVALNSLQPSTRATYGAGLLAFHVFCTAKDIAEEFRAPVSSIILQSFVSRMAGIYSASTVTNYIAGIRAWHMVHGVPWTVGGPELDTIIKGAKNMAPKSSTKKKRAAITVDYIQNITKIGISLEAFRVIESPKESKVSYHFAST